MNMLLIPIVVPSVVAVLVLLLRQYAVRSGLALLATLGNLIVAAILFAQVRAVPEHLLNFATGWAGFGMNFAFQLGSLGSFILLAAAGFAFLVTLYSVRFMEKHPHAGQFYLYVLLSAAMVNGAVMADNLVVLLFFWEGLLGTLFGMIAIGNGGGAGAWKTATKALIIAGLCDLCLMLGIAIVGTLSAGTLDERLLLSHLASHPVQTTGPTAGLAIAAFVLLMIGAVSKAGSMPFHTWIPDAAVDAPLPFMAFLPASLEKLLGIYLLTRITQDIFKLEPGSGLSLTMMILGSVTILLAVAMALVQKDYKRLLSYHAISQVGYMVLGIGTALPIGIVGGVFHMINHAMYKSCLFLTAGNVEKQAGTTALEKLGGLARNMPITFGCFVIAAASISGFPLTNGFYSKELIYHAALLSHPVFYAAAALGTLLTAASFLKLGHAAFLGKRAAAHDGVREAPLTMLLPAGILAAGCLVFGLGNALPLTQLVQPGLARVLEGEQFQGVMPEDATGWLLAGGTVVAIGLALVNHKFGVKRSGSGLGAVDHIHYAPGLATIYDLAQRGFFDPYNWLMRLAEIGGQAGDLVNRANDWLYDTLAVAGTRGISLTVRSANTGNFAFYVIWSLAGAAALIWFLLA